MENEFEEFCNRFDIHIRILDSLTTKIRGFCYYLDGEFIVAINSKLSIEEQRKTALHELSHVLDKHFDCSQNDVDICEHQAKLMIKNIEYLKRKYYMEATLL